MNEPYSEKYGSRHEPYFSLYGSARPPATRSCNIFTNFDAIDKSVRSSSKYIGFAFPLQSGLFSVDRFLLDGAVESLVRMRAVAKGGSRKKGGGGSGTPSTKNYKL